APPVHISITDLLLLWKPFVGRSDQAVLLEVSAVLHFECATRFQYKISAKIKGPYARPAPIGPLQNGDATNPRRYGAPRTAGQIQRAYHQTPHRTSRGAGRRIPGGPLGAPPAAGGVQVRRAPAANRVSRAPARPAHFGSDR